MSNEVVKLAHRYMKNPLRVFVDTDEPTVDSVQQKFVRVDEGGKFPTLRALLNHEHVTKGLIFCETKARAGELAQALQNEHYKALALHSDLSQYQRDSAVHSFRIGLTNLLVATEVAARGLDIPKVSHVVNYDMPDEPKMYFHRIGRTARAGKPGIALSLITRQDEDGFKRIRKMTSSDLREVADGLLPESRVGSKFLLPARPSQGQAAERLSSGRRPRRVEYKPRHSWSGSTLTLAEDIFFHSLETSRDRPSRKHRRNLLV